MAAQDAATSRWFPYECPECATAEEWETELGERAAALLRMENSYRKPLAHVLAVLRSAERKRLRRS